MTEEDKILEEIIDHAYTKGEINPQPCSFCGVVECATCLDQVKLLLKKALSKGKEIGIEKAKQENNSDTELTSNLKAFKKSMDVEDIDLAKLGITETATTPQATSYIRGYLKRNFGIQVKEPIDWYLHCFASDSAMKGYEEGEKNQTSKIAELQEEIKENRELIREFQSDPHKKNLELKKRIAEFESNLDTAKILLNLCRANLPIDSEIRIKIKKYLEGEQND